MEQVFPSLANAPGGAIIGLADNMLGLTEPAREATSDWTRAQAKKLLNEIQNLDPSYRLDALEPDGFPTTAEGQANLINRLRLDRAKAYYQKGDHRPLQVETLRFLQNRVDEAYSLGLQRLRAGQLDVRLSPQEALGNFVDGQVRDQLRALYRNMELSIEKGEPIQANRRAYNTPERIYSVPDSRVGNVAFDVSLTRKTLSTTQIKNFFRSDFKPTVVIIVRPRQLGANSTYVITKPKGS